MDMDGTPPSQGTEALPGSVNMAPSYMLPEGDSSQLREERRLQVREWKTLLQADGVQKKVHVTRPVSDQTDFKTNRGNERQLWTFHHDKGTIH